MRSAIPFDTHAFIKKLTAAGVPESQAEVHAEAIADLIDQQLATKADIAALRTDLEALEARLNYELRAQEARLQSQLQTLEIRLKPDLTLRFGGMLAAAVGILAALFKVL